MKTISNALNAVTWASLNTAKQAAMLMQQALCSVRNAAHGTLATDGYLLHLPR